MKNIMLTLIESGQLNKLQTQYDTAQKCIVHDADGHALTYQRLFLLFLIVLCGMAIAISILIIEIIRKKHVKQTASEGEV